MEFVFLNRDLMAFNQDLIKSSKPIIASNNEDHCDIEAEAKNKISLAQDVKKAENEFFTE